MPLSKTQGLRDLTMGEGGGFPGWCCGVGVEVGKGMEGKKVHDRSSQAQMIGGNNRHRHQSTRLILATKE